MNDETEEWRQIAGHPDYEVSSLGRVRSLARSVIHKNGKICRVRGRILRPSTSGKRLYLHVHISRRGTRYVHALVCEAFHGPRLTPKHEVAHWDGDKRNNRAANLRWATHRENVRDKFRQGTDVRGDRNPMARLTSFDVEEMRRLHISGVSRRELAERFYVHVGYVSLVCTRKRWAHV